MTAPSPIPMRERLRTDYHWTPRQREVLTLIARGKTNTAIGESLGISLDGAKWHVSEILSKLQAESREEAADYWRRYNGVAPRFSRVFRGLTGAVALKWVAGGAAVVVAGAAAAVAIAIALNQSSDEPNAGDATTPPAAVTPVPDTQQPNPGTANPVPGPSQPTNTTISLTQPVKSIRNSVMYTVTGCFQCDGPDVALQRHVADASGKLTSTTILEDGQGILAGWHIGHYEASPDGSVLAAIACNGEYCGPMGSDKPTSSWRIITSRDGGLTWNDLTRFAAEFAWIDLQAHGLLVGTHAGGEAPTEFRFISASGTTALVRPASLDVGAHPLILADSSVLWVNAGVYGDYAGLFRQDGTPVTLERPVDGTVAYRGVDVLPDGTIALFAYENSTNAIHAHFFSPGGAFIGEVDLGRGFRADFISPKLGFFNMDGLNLAQGDPGISYPVLVDLTKGIATPIMSDVCTQERGRNTFIAFRSGPFAEVKTGGDCLNVRESPTTSARSLVCYADSVLLRDLGETRDADGATWLKVATVDGREGWASLEFLTR